MIVTRVAWSDWPQVKQDLALEVVEVRVEPDAETVVYVRTTGKTPALEYLMDPIVIKPKNSKLSHRLAGLFEHAKANPGKPQRTELQSGLRIDVIYGIDGCVRMQISRQRVSPSNVEWRTTINHLPFDGLEIGEPERFEHKGAYYVRAEWPWRGGCE